jgi:hydrogenase/urease accessory protein HupE
MKHLLTLTFALLPAAAIAHPGDHHQFSLTAALTHALSEPDHLIGLAALAAVSAVGWSLWRGRKRASERARK